MFVAAGSGSRKEDMATTSYLGFDIVTSSTGRVWLTDEGDSVVIGGPFLSVQAAKDSIEDEWIASQGDQELTCPICDAFGCGGDGGGCYRYEGRGEIADPRDYDDYVDAF